MSSNPPNDYLQFGGHFSPQEWLRYTRHIQLDGFGPAGQRRLQQSHVLIVGAGGLGSPVSLYLAAAGVGHLTLVDHDHVDLSNLQRQIVFTEEDLGQSKVKSAKRRLQALNSHITIDAVDEALHANNAESLISSADLVIDCTDNFSTRYLINDVCCTHSTPWLFASIDRYAGQCSLFTPGKACFRCLFPQAPTAIGDCNSNGVIGVVPGLLGSLQASEAIRYLAGQSCSSEGHLLLVETNDLSIRRIALQSNPQCINCNTANKKTNDKQATTEPQCHIQLEHTIEINPDELKAMHDSGAPYLLLDVRTLEERENFHIGGMHIPLDELDRKLAQIPEQIRIVCYCQSGIRSLQAANTLNKNGAESLSLAGGLLAWLRNN